MSFLQLPGEIRNQIYSEALIQASEIFIPADCIIEPGILKANRQIRKEAESIYWSSNTFAITMQNYKSDPLLRLEKKYRRIFESLDFPFRYDIPLNQTPNCINLLKWLERAHSGVLICQSANAAWWRATEPIVYALFEMIYRYRHRSWEDLRPLVMMQCAELSEASHQWALGSMPGCV